MQYIVYMIVITLFFAAITYFKSKSFFRPNVIFSLIWIVGSIFLYINIGGIKNISNTTYMYIFLTVLSFNIGYLPFAEGERQKYDLETLRLIVDDKRYEKTLLWINFILVVICFPYFIKMLYIMITQSFYQVRVAAYVYSGVYESIVSRVVFWPMFAFFNIVLMLCAIKLFLGVKDYRFYLLTVFDILYFSMITGSRNFIAKFFVYIVVAYILGNFLLKKKRTIDFRIIAIGSLLAVILNAAIKARSLGMLSPLENVVVYLFGGISFFDNIIKNTDVSMLYGRGMFGWVVSPILYLFSLTGIIPNCTAEYIIGDITKDGIYISDDFNFNALTTAMYPLFRDFGVLGIVLGMIMYGGIVMSSEKKMSEDFNVKNLMMFFSFLVTIFESTQYYDMMYIRFSFQIFFIWFIFRKIKSTVVKIRT